ncbi:PTS sugar transporter subunit IIA [Geodermatophilus sp. Leaf369]|jgi:mannitol/fructose-specific phosphotransferase system IIA component|uniref:PTS sugar transporter subunit IIA n=1 Tax=Geodermatophilus sp. Leaf369 TaxID=1736354 RepID=UPI0006F6514F|nr:PTS sugar transporter subunit IIA [Geodermatophilus sp. Leaf369]KQS60444.1 PTS sugar transporter subunit IIA [Geodermatophilus sp. Leaf369]QNG37484.1 PTS sugar transporter subunit IIA [Geodermatophilaceae bacterium NBWT11]
MADGLVAGLLDPSRIVLDGVAADKTEAVRQAGELLVAAGAVTADYVASMLEREESISTYMGEGVAIPHGTNAGRESVLGDALTVTRYPAGVDWGNGRAEVVIGIAAVGDGHLPVLAALAQVLVDPEKAAELRAVTSVEQVLALLTADVED